MSGLDIVFNRRAVIGTPITPKALLPSLAGSSFCVSFADPRQLDQCIEFVGDDQILVLDNGAFTHWRKGNGKIDREAFWKWANDAQRRCPQAVAVIPDVIEGSEHENLLEVSWAIREGLAEFPERTMAIWHLNESLEQLEKLCRLMNFVGFGSCAEYDVQRNRRAYLERIREASAVVDRVEREHNRRPWIHLMRGLGVFAKLTRFESADSTNVAMNHHRHKATHGDDRARVMAERIRAQVAAGAADAELEAVQNAITNFDAPPTLRPKLAVPQQQEHIDADAPEPVETRPEPARPDALEGGDRGRARRSRPYRESGRRAHLLHRERLAAVGSRRATHASSVLRAVQNQGRRTRKRALTIRPIGPSIYINGRRYPQGHEPGEPDDP